MSKFIDHYFILGVKETATVADINTAYKRLCFKWHPDRHPGVEATYRMQEINEAKRILSDKERRETYNKEYRTNSTKSAKQNKATTEKANHEVNYSFNLKTDRELIRTCANAAKYSFEYIHAVLEELKERGYSFETVSNTIKQKTKPTV